MPYWIGGGVVVLLLAIGVTVNLGRDTGTASTSLSRTAPPSTTTAAPTTTVAPVVETVVAPQPAPAAPTTARVSRTAVGPPVPAPVVTTVQPPPASTTVVEQPPPTTGPGPLYANCDEVVAAGAAPIPWTDPDFRPEFDTDDDGVGCEPGQPA